MVITTDFNIFADKCNNKQHLPDDLINIIMNINTQNIKTEKQNKKKFNIVIQQLDVYQEEYKNYEEDSMIEYINLWKDGNKRCDCQFLDDNDLWETSYHDWMIDHYSAIEDIDFDEWYDDNF